MLLARVVDASGEVASTRSRKAKVEVLARCLAEADAEELPVVASWLAGSLRQRRTGVGWRSLSTVPSAAPEATLEVSEVDGEFESMSRLGGAGSTSVRAAALKTLLGAATDAEQTWLRGAITGEVRQGALDALLQEAIALATGIPLKVVRRAAMLAGSTPEVAPIAFSEGETGLTKITLSVGRPIQPMLASSAPSVAAALEKVGPGPVSVDAKLDGIRIQVHRDGAEVRVASRSLDDITARLPHVVTLVRSFPANQFVLDGEALAMHADGRPRAFQETASLTAQGSDVEISAYFFDLLHLDGADLLDQPGSARTAALDQLVPVAHRIKRLVTDDPVAAQRFFEDTVASGHEGVVVKSLSAAYDAGRRGAAWVKVKPVHTLDLVVLAVEEGSGRRKGWLSNIHLGARDPESGGFVMLVKTF